MAFAYPESSVSGQHFNAGPARIGWNISESDGLDADPGWVSKPRRFQRGNSLARLLA